MASTNRAASSTLRPTTPDSTDTRCCGGPPPEGVAGCCVRDVEMKRDGGRGCGCLPAEPFPGIADVPGSCC